MALRTLFLLAILFLSLSGKGMCGEEWRDLEVRQEETGLKGSDGQIERAVKIYNNSPCEQTNIIVSCPGFASVTVKSPPPRISVVPGDKCLIGGPVEGLNSVGFLYSSNEQLTFTPLSSTRGNCV